MKKRAYVTFANHFDLLWRRCWERDYEYQGKRYASYSTIETLILDEAIRLAEAGAGAYQVEQALTVRMYLRKRPSMLPRLQALHKRGLFEICGAGEAIIDVNMCAFETMARNMASGVHYCSEVLDMPPLLANHGDGFGSSAQFPQVIRGCGFPGIAGLSYSQPDNVYWRGLDGSTVFVGANIPGKSTFFDHCYQEPCRVCHNLTPADCSACNGTGLDLPQNTYPEFEPVRDADFIDGVSTYTVCSEEMLPPTNFAAVLDGWRAERDDIEYAWGTSRLAAHLWKARALAVDEPAADQIASRVENNPVQTGCLVSRIKIKQAARRCEGTFYGWEKALCLTALSNLDRQRWESLFLELPLFFFHDSVTGTHQDEAYAELMDRMTAFVTNVEQEALATLRRAGVQSAPPTQGSEPGQKLQVFNPGSHAGPVRAVRPVACSATDCWKARSADGREFPVIMPTHEFSPPTPTVEARLVPGVGPGARTRPEAGEAVIEARSLTPLAWSELVLERAAPPVPLETGRLDNGRLSVALGANGVDGVADASSGAHIGSTVDPLGALFLEEDEGDPWGTRRIPGFRKPLGVHTHYLGALQFEGYQEAYYAGRYEPNLRFGREEDPNVFGLQWYVTVRLLADVRRVDFQYELFWQAVNRRIRAVFPVGAPTDTGVYSIPGGWLRRERYDQTETHLWSPNGDWPALYFVASEPCRGTGWAVVNHGTPSARIEDGALMVSLLRAPGSSHCLHRYAQNYPMPVSGLTDGGWHQFTLSLLPHQGNSHMAELSAVATALNRRAPSLCASAAGLPATPAVEIDGEGVELVCAKPRLGVQGKGGLALRLLNPTSEPRRTDLTFHKRLAATEIVECDMTERRQRTVAMTDGAVQLDLPAFKATTLVVKTDG